MKIFKLETTIFFIKNVIKQYKIYTIKNTFLQLFFK